MGSITRWSTPMTTYSTLTFTSMKRYAILVILLLFPLCYSTALPVIQNIRQPADTVGLYEKFEISLLLEADYVNPFDPVEIEVTATFTAPSGKTWAIPGFYDYSGGAFWKVRFSPDEQGQWTYTVRVTDKSGQSSSEAKSFYAIPTGKKGPLIVAPNRRYLQHSDGSDFYGVGLWYNDGYAGYNSGRVTEANLDELKALGVNFISSFITPLETIGSGLGRYDQNICGRLDQLFEMLEERDMLLSLNLWFHSYLSETVWGGGNIRWYTNPYQHVTEASNFYSSEKAWEYQEKLYRYFIARWGYSRSLALWFVVDEVNGTDGWVSGDSLGAANWARKVHDYFKKNDPYDHPTTGTRSGGIKEFWHEGYQIFDVAGREIYEAQGFPMEKTATLDSAKVHPLTHSYKNYAGEIGRLWKGYEKPSIIGETGWDHTYYEPSMPGYLAMYHNALWVSLATGSAMSPFWWAYSGRLNDNVVTRQIRSLRDFTDQISFGKLTGITPFDFQVANGHGYGMKSNEAIFGWMVNPNTDVAGYSVRIQVPRGKYKLRLYHTWRGTFIHEEELQPSRGAVTIKVPSLKTQGGHANYVGQDVAFILTPVGKD